MDPESRLSFRRSRVVIRNLGLESEFAWGCYFISRFVGVCKAESEVDAMFAAEIAHRPAVDSGESRRVTEGELLVLSVEDSISQSHTF